MAAVAVAGPGCGDDKKTSAGSTDRYCELSRTLNEPPAGIDPASATPEQLTAAVKAHFAANMGKLDELQQVAPPAVAPDAAAYARVARNIAQTGDLDEFDTPANRPAIKRHETFNQKECGIEPPGP